MAKYLAMGSLTVDGVKALRKEKASGRRAAVTKIFEAAGGKVEAGYYAFGERDVFFILEFPDNVSAASVSLVINSSGLIIGALVKQWGDKSDPDPLDVMRSGFAR